MIHWVCEKNIKGHRYKRYTFPFPKSIFRWGSMKLELVHIIDWKIGDVLSLYFCSWCGRFRKFGKGVPKRRFPHYHRWLFFNHKKARYQNFFTSADHSQDRFAAAIYVVLTFITCHFYYYYMYICSIIMKCGNEEIFTWNVYFESTSSMLLINAKGLIHLSIRAMIFIYMYVFFVYLSKCN